MSTLLELCAIALVAGFFGWWAAIAVVLIALVIELVSAS